MREGPAPTSDPDSTPRTRSETAHHIESRQKPVRRFRKCILICDPPRLRQSCWPPNLPQVHFRSDFDCPTVAIGRARNAPGGQQLKLLPTGSCYFPTSSERVGLNCRFERRSSCIEFSLLVFVQSVELLSPKPHPSLPEDPPVLVSIHNEQQLLDFGLGECQFILRLRNGRLLCNCSSSCCPARGQPAKTALTNVRSPEPPCLRALRSFPVIRKRSMFPEWDRRKPPGDPIPASIRN
jgi:hypothetical protein